MGLAESSYSPNSVGWISNVFTAVFLPLVLIFVALRFYCRKKSKTSWGWDDVLVGIATIGQIGLAALSFDMTVNGGNGHHEAYLNSQPQTLRREGIDSFAIIVVYYAFVNIPKLAVLTLYHRLFSMHPYVILAIRLLIGVLIIQTLISVLLLLLTLRINSINPNYLQIYTSVPNIVTDVLMLLLPMPVVWRLHVPCSVKFGIALTFLVGSLGLVFSTARFYIFYYAYVTPDDVSYMAAVQETIWTEVEPGCYLICACMLLMRPLVDRLADSFLISILRSRRSSNSYSGNSYDSPETLAGGNSIAVTGGLVLHPRSYRTPLGDKGTRMSPRGRQDDDIEMQFPNENSASGLV